MRELASVGSESSSRLKLVGERPPPAVKAKSCASFGCASLTATIRPLWLLMNVHVIDSPADTLMFDTRLPSLQIADAWDQPLGTVSDTEYPEPAGTSLNVWVFESVPSASSSSEKLRRGQPATRA